MNIAGKSMTTHRPLLTALIVSLLVPAAPLAAQNKVEVTNNQPFPIAMPLKLLGENAPTVMVNVDANGKQTIDLPAKPALQGAGGAAKISIAPAENGIRLKSGDRDLGALSWDLVLEKIDKDVPDSQVDKTQRDFDKLFKALPMTFASTGKTELFETWSAEASEDGLKLRVELDVYPAGFVDVRSTFTNESAPKTNVAAAVVTRWQQPKVSSRTVNYNNVTGDLTKDGATPFRKGGGNPRLRHMMIQRGVDWLNFVLRRRLERRDAARLRPVVHRPPRGDAEDAGALGRCATPRTSARRRSSTATRSTRSPRSPGPTSGCIARASSPTCCRTKISRCRSRRAWSSATKNSRTSASMRCSSPTAASTAGEDRATRRKLTFGVPLHEIRHRLLPLLHARRKLREVAHARPEQGDLLAAVGRHGHAVEALRRRHPPRPPHRQGDGLRIDPPAPSRGDRARSDARCSTSTSTSSSAS